MVNDQKAVSQWIQNNRFIVYAIPWVLSLLWATLGLVLAGYGDIGACMSYQCDLHCFSLIITGCWFRSDKTRLLVNFLPRWLIIILMLGLYIRLHHIISRAHNNFVSFDDEYAYASESTSFPASSATPWTQSVHLSKLSDSRSDQERIVPPTPRPRTKVKRSRGAPDLKRVSTTIQL